MKLIIFAIALGFGINTQSQICVDNYLGEYRKVRLSKESIEDVKKRKTYFVVMDFENADQYELAVKQAWTLTPYECISQKEYLKIFDEEKIGNYFSLQGLNYDMLIKKKNNVTNLQETVLTIHNVKSYLRFFTQATKKDWNDIAKVALYPNNAMIQTLMGNKNTAIDSGKSETLIYNLTPGMYKIYLKILNDYISKGEKKSFYDNLRNREELEKLKKDTLYIPDYVLIHFDKWNGNEREREEDDMLKDYHFPYKLVTSAELSDLIMNSSKTLYVFDYIKDNTTKFINIYSYNPLETKIIYTELTNVTYNIKAKDFAAIF